MNKLKSMVLALIAFVPIQAQAAGGRIKFERPINVYVGTGALESAPSPFLMSHELNRNFAMTYMTAKEMKAKVRYLTGFLSSAFDEYEDVLGRWDPRSGTRTADRPSLVSVLFIKKISASVASSVIAREVFLDPGERVVFPTVDFDHDPTDQEITDVVSELYERWINMPLDDDLAADFVTAFHGVQSSSGTISAYQWMVETLLQHGANYYY